MNEKQFLVKIFKQSKKIIIITSAISIFLGCIELLSPLLSKRLIDDGLLNGNLNVIVKLALILCGIQLINGIIKYQLQLYLTKVKTMYSVKLNKEAFNHAIKMDVMEFEKEGLYKILNNVDYDISKISEVFGSDFFGIITEFFKLIACFLAMFYISWQLTLIMLVTVPIKLLFNKYINGKLKLQFKKMLEVIRDNSKWLGGIINGIYEIKLLNIYKKVESVFGKNTEKKAKIDLALNKINQLNEFLILYIDQVCSYFVYIVGTILMINGKISVGGIMVFASYVYFFFQPIEWYTRIKNSLAGIMPSVNNYLLFMKKPEENMKDKLEIPNFKTEIEFKNVDFDIDEKKILKNISVKFEMGDKIAITGSNGSGKTSLIKLLLKLYKPSKGAILFSGVDTEKFSVKTLREQFTVMNQNVFLFDLSIKDNINILDNNSFELDEKQEELLQFVKKLPDGIDKNVGLNGNRLSGGEKQRVAMVRTLNKNARILVIDEGTSNCDFETYELINKIIKNNRFDITIVITHDINKLNSFNRVINMDNGKIVNDIRKDKLIYDCI